MMTMMMIMIVMLDDDNIVPFMARKKLTSAFSILIRVLHPWSKPNAFIFTFLFDFWSLDGDDHDDDNGDDDVFPA